MKVLGVLALLVAVCSFAGVTGTARAASTCNDETFKASTTAAIDKLQVALDMWEDAPRSARAYALSGWRIMYSSSVPCSSKLRPVRSHLLTGFSNEYTAASAAMRGDHVTALVWTRKAMTHFDSALAALA